MKAIALVIASITLTACANSNFSSSTPPPKAALPSASSDAIPSISNPASMAPLPSVTPSTAPPQDVQKFTFSNEITLDGTTEFCLDYVTGKLQMRDLTTNGRFFLSDISFNVTRSNGQVETLVLQSETAQQVPNWQAHCDARPVLPQAIPLKQNRNPTDVRVEKRGTQSCLYVDDGNGNRGGATRIVGFDFGLVPCP